MLDWQHRVVSRWVYPKWSLDIKIRLRSWCFGHAGPHCSAPAVSALESRYCRTGSQAGRVECVFCSVAKCAFRVVVSVGGARFAIGVGEMRSHKRRWCMQDSKYRVRDSADSLYSGDNFLIRPKVIQPSLQAAARVLQVRFRHQLEPRPVRFHRTGRRGRYWMHSRCQMGTGRISAGG